MEKMNCTLLGDKDYLSSTQQIDLIFPCSVKLKTTGGGMLLTPDERKEVAEKDVITN